jgi:hypothetical protein
VKKASDRTTTPKRLDRMPSSIFRRKLCPIRISASSSETVTPSRVSASRSGRATSALSSLAWLMNTSQVCPPRMSPSGSWGSSRTVTWAAGFSCADRAVGRKPRGGGSTATLAWIRPVDSGDASRSSRRRRLLIQSCPGSDDLPIVGLQAPTPPSVQGRSMPSKV